MSPPHEDVAMEIFQTIQVVVPVGPVSLEGGDQLFLIVVMLGKRSPYRSDLHQTIYLSMPIL